MSAIQSVLAVDRPDIRIAVSDNSTQPKGREALIDYCSRQDPERVRMLTPPQPMAMTPHWQWGLDQAQGLFHSRRVTFLTDRMLFRPGSLGQLLHIAASFPSRIVSYNHDLIDDWRRPVRLNEFRWTGRVVEIDSTYLLQLASRALHPPCNPRFLNCLVPIEVLDKVRARFGGVFASISPDLCFAYRALEVTDSILYWDRSALINYAYDRSNGASYSRGMPSVDGADFLSELGDVRWNHATPVPEFHTITNAVMNEYAVVRAETHSAKFPPIEMSGYLEAMARDIEHIEEPKLAAAQRVLLVEHGGKPAPRGFARAWSRFRQMLTRDPGGLARKIVMRGTANSLTQPAWFALGRLGIVPPPSRWFDFASTSEALDWTLRFPRRPTRRLRRLDWLSDAAHVREVAVPTPLTASGDSATTATAIR
jgi:hypothetical protein